MALNLEEIVFGVDTSQLDVTSKKLDRVTVSLVALDKAIKATNKSSGTSDGLEKPMEKVSAIWCRFNGTATND